MVSHLSGENFGPFPEIYRGPNWEDCPRAESVPEPSDNESESPEILISSDNES